MPFKVESQLADVVVVASLVVNADDGTPYATTRIIRLDLEIDSLRALDQFLDHISGHPSVVESSLLRSIK